jgi:hypothetical protein
MSRFHFNNKQLLEKLVRETVKSVLMEASPAIDEPGTAKVGRGVVSRPEQAPQKTRFVFDRFKALDTPQERFQYAESSLQRLGSGSGRVAYKLDDKHALKIPVPQNEQSISAGQKQNKAELGRCSADPEHNILLAKVYPDLSDEVDGNWLVVDLARPMDERAFKGITKIDWNVFVSGLTGTFNKEADDQAKQDAEILSSNEFFKKVLATINGCKLIASDVASLENWGIVNGAPVMIDYGYTKQLSGKIQTARLAMPGGI